MQVGAAQTAQYLPLLQNKRVGLVVNQTSVIQDTHLVDFLLTNNIDVKLIFAPEHGFRGNKDAGASVESGIDAATGVPVLSIYGKHKKPQARHLQDLDLILFDIQDVGARFYTYLSSMHYMMQAASENQLSFIVLDRPNPNIRFVQGPILEQDFSSFVGIHPIPVLHGMTLGELAQMILAEGWLNLGASSYSGNNKLDLTIVPVKDYNRRDTYDLPIKPSPNLPNAQAIRLYPSLCLFEATPISVGRGTQMPFQVIGHDKVRLGAYPFTPLSMPGTATHPKLENRQALGVDLRNSHVQGFDLAYLFQWHQAFAAQGLEFFSAPSFFDKLAGTDKIRLALKNKMTLKELERNWRSGIEKFKRRRKPYLIYQE